MCTTGPGRAAPVPGKWRAAAVYTVLTLVLMYPLWVHPGTTVPDSGPDTQLGIWTIGWDVHALTHGPLSIFDANMFYPHKRTLAYQDSFIGSALLVAPLLWITGNPVVAVNAVPLLACILCGLGGYVLGRRLGFSAAAAFIGGLIFAFSPARFFRLTQLGLAPVQWIPLTLASLHAYLDQGDKRHLRLASAFFAMQTLTSGHGAMFLVVAIVVLLAYRVVFGEPIRLTRRLRDLGVIGGVLLLLAASIYVPYRMNQIEHGLRRDLSGWDTTPESFLASPTTLHERVLSLAGLSWVNDRASGFLFPGYLPILLSLVAIASALATVRVRYRELAPSMASLETVARVALVSAVAVAAVAVLWCGTDVVTALTGHWIPAASALLAGALLAAAGAGREQRETAIWLIRPLAAVVLVWALLMAARSALPAGNGLTGEYYANEQLKGAAAITRVDVTSSTRALTAAWRGRPPSKFSARWTGYLAVGRAGLYRFATESDDGSRVFVDGNLVVDNSGVHSIQMATGSVALSSGPHKVTIEYEQSGGDWAMAWSWADEGSILQPVPGWRLSQRRVKFWVAAIARLIELMLLAGAACVALIAALWLRLTVPSQWIAWRERAATLRRSPVPLYLAVTLLCLGLSLGPPHGLWRHVYSWPGFSFIRVSRRFMIPAVLGIAVLAAAGFDRIASKLTPARRRAATLAIGALLIAEFAGVPIATMPFELNIPAADRWLASQPTPFAVAEVPVIPDERRQTMFMLHSMAHWQRTVAGYGGMRPALSERLNAELRTFPDDRSIRHLAEIGVSYVVVHRDLYPAADWPSVETSLRQFTGTHLKLVYSDDTTRVYSLLEQ